MKCFSWSYDETSKECNLIPAGIINLYEDTNFISPPGYGAVRIWDTVIVTNVIVYTLMSVLACLYIVTNRMCTA